MTFIIAREFIDNNSGDKSSQAVGHYPFILDLYRETGSKKPLPAKDTDLGKPKPLPGKEDEPRPRWLVVTDKQEAEAGKKDVEKQPNAEAQKQTRKQEQLDASKTDAEPNAEKEELREIASWLGGVAGLDRTKSGQLADLDSLEQMLRTEKLPESLRGTHYFMEASARTMNAERLNKIFDALGSPMRISMQPVNGAINGIAEFKVELTKYGKVIDSDTMKISYMMLRLERQSNVEAVSRAKKVSMLGQ